MLSVNRPVDPEMPKKLLFPGFTTSGKAPALFVEKAHRRLGVRNDHQLLLTYGAELFRVDISR